ncbi:two-component system activity regulator YycH [Virgibacillus necropolis]|uniref:YycH family regulatory protein n=1 Tax=Virgibacillus necropolis TaxID=163877 RepID=UPI00384F04B8
MKLESIKSFTLTMLVGISLLLTFGLWSFQPNDDVLPDQDLQNVNIGGKTFTNQDLIRPSTILFHTNNEHYSFANNDSGQRLYEEMQSWRLNDFQLAQEKEQSIGNRRVEVIFPEALPMEIVRSLFRINNSDSVDLPNLSFKKIGFTLNQVNASITMHFMSESGRTLATAIVNNASKYNLLLSYMEEKNGLNELITFEIGNNPIYIPLDSVTLYKRRYTVTHIAPTKGLVDALFSETTLVEKSGSSFTDGISELKLSNSGRTAQFINSAYSDAGFDRIPALDLLQYSRLKINDHKGWTDNFRLVKINSQINMIRYRMYYEGYPAFSDTNLSTIEQQFRNNGNLYIYNRPLISLNRVLPEKEEITLKSGVELISYLEREFSNVYDLAAIQDIKIGYEYEYNDDSSYSVTLTPAWFVKLDDEWQLIDFEPKKGGAVDAMEPN